ncbi:MAG: MarR family winged helix-turn-helix transcriptional regulator [Nocardioidaceae bacterium]
MPTQPTDESPLRALDEVLAGVRTMQQRPVYRRAVTADLGMSGGFASLRVLRAIEWLAEDGAPSISDIANRLAVEHSTASRAVDVVVRDGLVSRTACERDQRRTRLALTADGRGILRKSTTRRVRLLEEVTAGWEPNEIESLSALLERLLAGFDRLEPRS